MAHVGDSARTYGTFDPIDALAVARAAQREPDLPHARLDGPDRDVRLLGDHRESLVAERTRAINRLRWYLHELDPSWEARDPSALARASQTDDETPPKPAATAAWKHCACSNGGCPTSSTQRYEPTSSWPSKPRPLDRGARDSPSCLSSVRHGVHGEPVPGPHECSAPGYVDARGAGGGGTDAQLTAAEFAATMASTVSPNLGSAAVIFVWTRLFEG